jgi:hypothetical protein
MVKLENKTIEKLASEGKISHTPADEAYEIYLSIKKTMDEYKRIDAKREYTSHAIARKTILNA